MFDSEDNFEKRRIGAPAFHGKSYSQRRAKEVFAMTSSDSSTSNEVAKEELIGGLGALFLLRMNALERIADAARVLRAKQRDYMDHRGDDERGRAVAEAAENLDVALGAVVSSPDTTENTQDSAS